jgi:hypothetical protein
MFLYQDNQIEMKMPENHDKSIFHIVTIIIIIMHTKMICEIKILLDFLFFFIKVISRFNKLSIENCVIFFLSSPVCIK